jgi:hypothetical protein
LDTALQHGRPAGEHGRPWRRRRPYPWGRDLPPPVVVLVALFLAGGVLAAVHHAEVVAHQSGVRINAATARIGT